LAAARVYVQWWLSHGTDPTGAPHFKLQFDLNNTWSTKYNLMWQNVLGLDLFPESVSQAEVSWYLSHANTYGVPLDSRGSMAKVDWMSWAAAFAQSDADAKTIFHFLYMFANATPSRSPFSDWYDTKTNTRIGFTARPVLGGLWAKPLIDKVKQTQTQTQTTTKLQRKQQKYKHSRQYK